ncbi:MAG: pilus assembly protein TadG-related protein [Phycisphaerales bacterium]
MTRRRPQHRSTRRGFSSANTVVWLPVIIMTAWLALEVALLYRGAYRAQAAADAGALAAAARYRDGRAAASDDALAAAGASDGPAGPITIDVGDGTSGGEDLEFGTWDEDTRTFSEDPPRAGRPCA